MEHESRSWFSRLQQLFTLHFQPPVNLAEALLSVVDPRSPYLLGAFFCGFFALSAWGNFFYTLIIEGLTSNQDAWGRLGISTGALTACAVLLYFLDVRKRQKDLIEAGVSITGIWEQPREAKHYPGLITIFNPFNPELNKFIVKRHTASNVPKDRRLRCCWCIMDQKPETLEKFRIFQDDLQDTLVEFLPHFIIDAENVQQTYLAVDQIYREGIRKKGLYTLDVVTDITAGMKPMSVGMAFACLMYDRHVEYIQCEYDKANNKIREGTERPIELDVNFYLKRR